MMKKADAFYRREQVRIDKELKKALQQGTENHNKTSNKKKLRRTGKDHTSWKKGQR